MILGHILYAFIIGAFTAKTFEHLSAKWFCDYGEAVSEKHLKQNRHLNTKQVLIFAAIIAGAEGLYCCFSKESYWLNKLSFSLTIAVLLLIALSDVIYNIIPNELLAIALLFSLPIAFKNGYMQPITGLLVGGGLLFAVFFIASKLLKKEAMGFGDVLLSALCGFVCGAMGYIIVIFTAVLSAAIVFIVLIAVKKIDKDKPQPFGPFLVTGLILTLCFWPYWQILLQAYFYI